LRMTKAWPRSSRSPAAASPGLCSAGDQPVPAREELCDPRLREPVRIEVARRPPPRGRRPRDGPALAYLRPVA
jgi:hypothetical protein